MFINRAHQCYLCVLKSKYLVSFFSGKGHHRKFDANLTLGREGSKSGLKWPYVFCVRTLSKVKRKNKSNLYVLTTLRTQPPEELPVCKNLFSKICLIADLNDVHFDKSSNKFYRYVLGFFPNLIFCLEYF